MKSDLSIHKIFARLSAEDIAKLDTIVPALEGPEVKEWASLKRKSPRWQALSLRFCTHYVPESRARTGLSPNIPGPGIHMMQRKDKWFVGDFYSANMALECLSQVGLGVEDGNRYLDFGCSSGPLVRVLATYAPGADCYGVDPVADSIAWAQENLPGCHFEQSNQSPPLPFRDDFFAGVTAISIWSHFSETAALAWFDEMARIIQPGGWLMFTTHGLTSIDRIRRLGTMSTERIDRIEASLLKNSYHFEDMFGNQHHFGLETADWGNSYLLPGWVTARLSDQWHIRLFVEGRNQHNQDCYVLTRR